MKSATFLDRLIAKVSPETALRRVAARNAFEAFSGLGSDGASMSPTNGRWKSVPRSANADMIRALPRQRAECREIRATNPIGSGAIGTNINRTVGTGIQPVPVLPKDILGLSDEQADLIAQQIATEFSLWADSKECTLEGNQTFYERQALVLGSTLDSGDCATVLPDGKPTATQPYKLRMQLIEADRIGNPQNAADTAAMVAGIRLSEGAATACHIYNNHPGSNITTGDKFAGQWYEYTDMRSGRKRCLHHFRPTRGDQARGVPYLAPVVQAIKDLGRYTEAEITAAVMSAFYTVFIEQEGGANPAPVFGAATPPAAAGGSAPEAGVDIAMAPGAVIGLAKGEKISIADPKRPNTAYEPFVTGVLKLIAVGLHMPVELLLKSFNASFSASKAALLDAWQHFRTQREWLVLSFCQPVYETWFAEAVIAGRIEAPGFFDDPLIRWAWTRALWFGDSPGSINLKDEIAAYRDAIDARLITHERASWELFGTNWNSIYARMKTEKRRMDEDGMTPAPKAGAASAAAQGNIKEAT